ncbi:hypothetical protein SAMN06265373_11521, partial [Shimia sagamensis]
ANERSLKRKALARRSVPHFLRQQHDVFPQNRRRADFRCTIARAGTNRWKRTCKWHSALASRRINLSVSCRSLAGDRLRRRTIVNRLPGGGVGQPELLPNSSWQNFKLLKVDTVSLTQKMLVRMNGTAHSSSLGGSAHQHSLAVLQSYPRLHDCVARQRQMAARLASSLRPAP